MNADKLCRNSGGAEHLVSFGFFQRCGEIWTNDVFRAMTRDEDVYQDADSFLPERFLKADGTLNDDTVDYAFGFGRRYVAFMLGLVHNAHTVCLYRICPGRAFAETEVRV